MMVLTALYVLFIALITSAGWLVGLLAEDLLPGSGVFITVTIFCASFWYGWLIAVAICERYWPVRPAMPHA